MQKIRTKFETENFHSIHNPLVLMKFNDVTGRENHSRSQAENDARQSMKGHQYSYFIKIYGHLDLDGPINQYQKATFTLKVYVFDSKGNLIGKSKSRSYDKVKTFDRSATVENYPLNEQEFFELVTDAANTLEITI
jgi:hypothetical protein